MRASLGDPCRGPGGHFSFTRFLETKPPLECFPEEGQVGRELLLGLSQPQAELGKERPFSETPVSHSQPLLITPRVGLSALADARGSHLSQVRTLEPGTDLNQKTFSLPSGLHSRVTISGSPVLASFLHATPPWPHGTYVPFPHT